MQRHWACGRIDPDRKKFAREDDIRAANQLEVRGHPSWERTLTARPTMPLKKRSAVETFNWHVKPKDGLAIGRVYPDGYARDGPTPELVRLGWAFVVINDEGNIIAAACGVPPHGSWTSVELKLGLSSKHCSRRRSNSPSIGLTATR